MSLVGQNNAEPTLGYCWYQVYDSLFKLQKAFKVQAPQSKITEINERIELYVSKLEYFHKIDAKAEALLRSRTRKMNVVKVVGGGVVGLGAFGVLGASIANQVTQPVNDTVVTPVPSSVLGLGIFTAACGLVSVAINGVIGLYEDLVMNPVKEQDARLKEAKSIRDFWVQLKELMRLSKENTDDVKVEMDANATPFSELYERCKSTLKEIKIESSPDLEKKVKERFVSLVLQSLPDDHPKKQAFLKSIKIKQELDALKEEEEQSMLNHSQFAFEPSYMKVSAVNIPHVHDSMLPVSKKLHHEIHSIKPTELKKIPKEIEVNKRIHFEESGSFSSETNGGVIRRRPQTKENESAWDTSSEKDHERALELKNLVVNHDASFEDASSLDNKTLKIPKDTNDSVSTSPGRGFLNTDVADRGHLSPTNRSFLVNSAGLKESYDSHLQILTDEFGFEICDLYEFDTKEKKLNRSNFGII